jgi:hypothetical protein
VSALLYRLESLSYYMHHTLNVYVMSNITTDIWVYLTIFAKSKNLDKACHVIFDPV